MTDPSSLTHRFTTAIRRGAAARVRRTGVLAAALALLAGLAASAPSVAHADLIIVSDDCDAFCSEYTPYVGYVECVRWCMSQSPAAADSPAPVADACY